MDWEKQLQKYFYEESWSSGVKLMEEVLHQCPNNVDGYIQIIYLLHFILVESSYPEYDKNHDYYASLLKKYYYESEQKFSDNPEYLFFVGKILYIAEWYFGLNDGLKPIEDMKAFKMQKKASYICPENKLFRWACMFSLSDPRSYSLAKIIIEDHDQISWLKTKGIAGKYILDTLYGQLKNI